VGNQKPYTYIRNCAFCGKEYTTPSRRQRCCSRTCAADLRRSRKMDVACQQCGKMFHSVGRDQKYCSRTCQWNAQKRVTIVTCVACGKEFEATPWMKRKYCSKTCAAEAGWDGRAKARIVQKECVECGKVFESVWHRRRKVCSRECSGKRGHRAMAGGRVPKKDRHGRKQSRRAVLRIDGRHVMIYRYIMEQHLGRELEPQERVHHIDCDPHHDELDNLDLLENESVHRQTHFSIQELVKPLLERGIIGYDRINHKYYVVQ
jgi:hypothetical protein